MKSEKKKKKKLEVNFTFQPKKLLLTKWIPLKMSMCVIQKKESTQQQQQQLRKNINGNNFDICIILVVW